MDHYRAPSTSLSRFVELFLSVLMRGRTMLSSEISHVTVRPLYRLPWKRLDFTESTPYEVVNVAIAYTIKRGSTLDVGE